MSLLNAENYKECLSKFATGVTVVTTNHQNSLHGITINSFNSVSLDPPLILFSIDKSSSLHKTLINNNFTINILSKEQQELSNIFAKPTQVNWNSIDYSLGKNTCPTLVGSSGIIECTPHANYEGGDHTIIVGKVTQLDYTNKKPLIYYSSHYYNIGEILK